MVVTVNRGYAVAAVTVNRRHAVKADAFGFAERIVKAISAHFVSALAVSNTNAGTAAADRQLVTDAVVFNIVAGKHTV